MNVSAIGERRLLARIRARLPLPPRHVVVGIGDDAAVLSGTGNAQLVLTTDALVEGVHFEHTFSAPADIGHKALAVNLSDLAAMGAKPDWALLSLALPDDTQVEVVEGIVDGLVALAEIHNVALVGGNLSRSPGPLVVDITAVGTVRPRRALTRSGGQPGDELYVSGTIGAGAAGLEMLQASHSAGEGQVSGAGDQICVARYRQPAPRVRLGRALGQSRAVSAAMDLSDGLADALFQVAEASECGVEIDADALPIELEARRWWQSRKVDPVLAALAGGDDYELLVAVPPKWRGRLRHVRSRITDPPLTRIGMLTRSKNERVLVRSDEREELPGAAYVHF